LGELVANALDAGATTIDIELRENDLHGLESVSVSDNGCRISPDVLKQRFVMDGVEALPQVDRRLGRLGVGGLAVHRIGSVSK
jgi:hypothetical protein